MAVEISDKDILDILSQIDIGSKVDANLIAEKLFTKEFYDNFHDSLNKNFTIPVSKGFERFTTNLSKKLQDIDKNENFQDIVDPFGFSDKKNNLKTEGNFILDRFRKILNKNIADLDDATSDEAKKTSQKGGILGEGVSSLLSNKLPEQKTDELEQKGFGPKENVVTLSDKTLEKEKGFFGDLFKKFGAELALQKKKEGTEDDKGGSALGKILGSGLSLLMGSAMALYAAFTENGPGKGLLEGIGKIGAKGAFAAIAKKLFGATLKTTLKHVPIIGTLISAGFAWDRYRNNDTFGFIVEIVSGLVQLLDFVAPGLGTVLSTGVDVFQAMMDAKGGGSDGKASAKKMSIMGDWAKGVWRMLEKTPFIGGLFRELSGMWDFWSGVLSGDMSLAKAGLIHASEGGGIFGAIPSMVLGLFNMGATTGANGKVAGFSMSTFMTNFKKNVGKTILGWFGWLPKSWQKSIADFMGVEFTAGTETTESQQGKPTNNNAKEITRESINKFKEENKAVLTDKSKFGTEEQINAQKKLDEMEKALKDKEQSNETAKRKAESDARIKDMEARRGLKSLEEDPSEENKRKHLEALNEEKIKPVESGVDKSNQQNDQKYKEVSGDLKTENQTPSDVMEFGKKPSAFVEEAPKVFDQDAYSNKIKAFVDDKGVNHILDTNDQSEIVSAKEGGILLNALNEIKQVMLKVNNNISKISTNNEGGTGNHITSVNVSGGGTQQVDLFSESAVTRERKQYYSFRGALH